MNAPLPFTCDGEQLVTASDLVRTFGVWQDRAVRAPVYILHRGRPRLVLTSVELMDALCAPHAVDAPQAAAQLAALLDTMREPALFSDRDCVVLAAGRAARARLGEEARAGTPLAALVAGATTTFADAFARVVASGSEESVEITPARYPTRRLAVTIAPAAWGATLLARDVTAEDRLGDLRAEAEAITLAGIAAGGAAPATINLRGYCEAPGPALAALTGVSPAALAAARFVTLFAVAGRVALGEAIEAVIADGTPRAFAAELLVNRAAPAAVRVGLAPQRRGGAIEAVAALIVRSDASSGTPDSIP